MSSKGPKSISKSDIAPKIDDIKKDSVTVIEKILGDVDKSSATKQLLIGVSSGWLTGYLAIKLGKVAACAVGGGIILLEVANQKGYIKINYDKINAQADRVTDRIQETVTGQGPSWTDKVLTLVRNRTTLTAGFLGGLFLGFASH